jgi:hypothetical protein
MHAFDGALRAMAVYRSSSRLRRQFLDGTAPALSTDD